MSGDTEHYKNLFRDMPVMLAVIGLDGSIAEANPAWKEFTGFSGDELTGKPWADFIHPEDIPALQEAQQKLLTGGGAAQVEGRVRCRDGSYKWVLISGALDSSKEKFWTSASDITSRREAEAACRDSESYLRRILDSAAIPMAVVTLDGTIEYINHKVTDTFGYTHSDIPDMDHWWPLAYPDEALRRESAERWMASVREALEDGGEIRGAEYAVTCKDGAVRHCYFFGTVIAGKAFVMLEDVTARVKAQEDLKASEHLLRRIIDKAPISMSIVGFDERIEYINAAAEATFGFPNSEIPTMNDWWRLAYPDEAYRAEVVSSWMGRVHDAIKRNGPIEGGEYNITCKDGTVKTCFVFGVIAAQKVFVMFDDITERVRVRQSLLRVIEDAPIAIAVSSKEGKLELLNRKFTQTFGYVQDDIPDLETMARTVYPDADYRREVLEYWAGVQASPPKPGEEMPPREFRVRCKDGSDKVVTSATVTTSDNKIITINEDVTEKVRAQTRIKESEQRLRLILESAPIPIVLHDLERTHFVNRRFTEFFGYSLDEIPTLQAWAELAYPDKKYREDLLKRFLIGYEEARKGTGSVSPVDATIRCKDGSLKVTRISTQILSGGDMVASIEDLTEQITIEQILRSSEKTLRRTIEQAPVAMVMHTLDGKFHIFNKKLQQVTGYTLKDVPDLDSWTRRAYPDENYRKELLDFWTVQIERSIRTGQEMDPIDVRLVCRDGSVKQATITAVVTPDKNVIAALEDITQRRETERALRESESLYRSLIETTGTGYVVIDGQGRVLDANVGYVRLTGHSDLKQIIGRSVLDWTAPYEKEKNAAAVAQCAKDGQISGFEVDYKGPGGKIIPVEISATVVHRGGVPQIITLCRDITVRRQRTEELRAFSQQMERLVQERTVELRRANEELTMEIAQRMDAERSREKLQQDLLQAQKMELVGLLASGITHDFNNILVTISGTAEVLLKTLASDSPVRPDIEEILKETERGTLLTRQLGGISRKKPVVTRRLDVNAVISDTLRMLQKLLGPEVRLSTDLAKDLPPVRADEGQMMQVIMNLIVNARDAMPDGGRVSVATAAESVKDVPPDMHLPVPPGDYVVLSVSDTGTGIETQALKKIFDPFFTTKAEGKGTGLGLSIVFGIVNKAGGGIEVRTAPGGTTFRIYLPEEKGA